MSRYASLLLCAFVAVAAGVMAAPAPFPRLGRTEPWITGWDRPVDLVGDCRFDRKGDTLTISVPGKGHQFVLGLGRKWCKAPHLLREVEGDFIIDVSVGGNFLQCESGSRRAGILLLAGENGAKLYLEFDPERQKHYLLLDGCCCSPNSYQGREIRGPLPGKTMALRLERRGQTVLMKASLDGQGWKTVFKGQRCFELPRKVKVGVMAESTARGTFKAIFDTFRLTPLGGKTG
jgi:regulation of enolase protein 1 (concanavalin A-like superfamily)